MNHKKKLKLKKDLLDEILDSRIAFGKKMKILKMLDKLFRKELGIIYLSDKELDNNDILNRSI